MKIHRLVAQAFMPNNDNKPCIDHVDGNRTNNTYSNLRWVTPKENTNNIITLNNIRTNCKAPEPTKRKVICIETNKEYKSLTEASNEANIDESSISKCCRGKRKTAGGLHWKYKD